MAQTDNLAYFAPEPLTYFPVNIENDEQQTIEYTDCVEVSLLHMLHTFFIDFNNAKQMNETLVREKVTHTELLYFLLNNNYIMSDVQFRNKKGLKIRTEWTELLTRRDGFEYVIDDKYELKSTLPNLTHFFDVFFPELNLPKLRAKKHSKESNNFQEILDRIGEYFSRENYDITFRWEFHNGKQGELPQHADIFVEINGKTMRKWVISELFLGTERITGHSHIYVE
jgi:hypothetical protein